MLSFFFFFFFFQDCEFVAPENQFSAFSSSGSVDRDYTVRSLWLPFLFPLLVVVSCSFLQDGLPCL